MTKSDAVIDENIIVTKMVSLLATENMCCVVRYEYIKLYIYMNMIYLASLNQGKCSVKYKIWHGVGGWGGGGGGGGVGGWGWGWGVYKQFNTQRINPTHSSTMKFSKWHGLTEGIEMWYYIMQTIRKYLNRKCQDFVYVTWEYWSKSCIYWYDQLYANMSNDLWMRWQNIYMQVLSNIWPWKSIYFFHLHGVGMILGIYVPLDTSAAYLIYIPLMSMHRQTSNIRHTLWRNKIVDHSDTCSWSIACRHCPNYIFILNFTPGVNGLGEENCKTMRYTFIFVIWCVLCWIFYGIYGIFRGAGNINKTYMPIIPRGTWHREIPI